VTLTKFIIFVVAGAIVFVSVSECVL